MLTPYENTLLFHLLYSNAPNINLNFFQNFSDFGSLMETKLGKATCDYQIIYQNEN